jgi:hypothetical protein
MFTESYQLQQMKTHVGRKVITWLESPQNRFVITFCEGVMLPLSIVYSVQYTEKKDGI